VKEKEAAASGKGKGKGGGGGGGAAAPEWVLTQQEIASRWKGALSDLQHTAQATASPLQQHSGAGESAKTPSTPASPTLSSTGEAEAAEEVAAAREEKFRNVVGRINGMTRAYNMIVPQPRFQRPIVSDDMIADLIKAARKG
jgi:hypothetical protein